MSFQLEKSEDKKEILRQNSSESKSKVSVMMILGIYYPFLRYMDFLRGEK